VINIFHDLSAQAEFDYRTQRFQREAEVDRLAGANRTRTPRKRLRRNRTRAVVINVGTRSSCAPVPDEYDSRCAA
jgi:hypothetical protein